MSRLVSYQQQVTLSFDIDLFFKSAAFGRLVVNIAPGEVSVDERTLARSQSADYGNANFEHLSADRPLLRVNEAVFDVDHVLTDLVLECWIFDALEQFVHRVNIRVNRLEPTDLLEHGRPINNEYDYTGS